ncbi:MFS transporter [Pseudomonas sp. SORT22]|uniref:MFS transporter n=1 Tax=Pseudomonas sp. SORT22 TaxID=2813842 RepID=UPI001BCC1C71|nr:MFS transporter [Pseudomonas sp. SORT22]QVM94678.1 MFS transporter [Pseudomonas sp. SORT22]
MHRYKRPAVLAAAYLGTFLASLDISIVNLALPSLQNALATDLGGLQWVVSIYAVALSAFMLSAGPVADRYGHKRAWLTGVALFTAGSALCALAEALPMLLFGRAVQGIAGALLIPGAMPLITQAFPEPRARAHAIGGWSAFSALALVLGPLLGGVLLQHFGWQSIFLINLPLGVLALLLGAWGISERAHPQQAALDPWGQLLSVCCLGALSYGLIRAGESGFAAPAPSLAIGLALIALLALIAVEKRVARPLVPLDLFRDRRFAVSNLASWVLGFSSYSSLFFFSLFLQQAQALSATESGLRMMPTFIASGALSLMFGRLQRHFALEHLLAWGYGLIGMAMTAMALLSANTPYWPLLLCFVTLGLGMGLAVPATGLVVMNAVPASRAGIASATMNALRQTGMSLGIALLGSLMSLRASAELTRLLTVAGVDDAATLAQQAVAEHPLSSATPLFAQAYATAMAAGFNLAMLAAGLCSLGCAVLLQRQLPVPSASATNESAQG